MQRGDTMISKFGSRRQKSRPRSWQQKPRFSSWLQKIKQHPVITTAIIVACVLIVVLIGGYFFNWGWTGFNAYSIIWSVKTPGNTMFIEVDEQQSAKTLWDWLQLLGVLAIPVVVGLGTVWFTAQQGKVRDAENKDNQREAALRTYIDKMSKLLLDKKLRGSAADDEVRKIARVRTITILFQLDARRIGYVFAFLREVGLMSNTSNSSTVSLSQADLSRIDLSKANLSEANLSETNLSEANLSGANLSEANLSEANLHGANLNGDDLSGANLSGADLNGAFLHKAFLNGANLSGADLNGANLSEANLSGANLHGAFLHGANLSGANLKDTAGITIEELEKDAKSLQGTAMPDGSVHP
jgi:uncharacterized protein YjbI with pentapeptide repeats